MHVYAVHEVTTYLRELFETDPHLSDVWISGEVSNVSRPASGHVYFTLKEGESQLRCAFFARRDQPSKTTSKLIQNGDALVAHGRIGLYEQRGDLQLYVDFVQPEGIGALQAEFERLKTKLGEEGMFEEARKRPLPRFPHKIGIITSPSGAVFHDICHVLQRRWPLAELVLAPTPVQGPDAAAGIVGAFATLNARSDIEAIIVGRGGGAPEELWAFNEEPVVRAIFASHIPVISAVGHETDYTLADFVADHRSPTPSAAAEIVAPDRIDVTVRLGIAAGTMASVINQQIRSERERIRQAAGAIEHRAPDVDRERQRIDDTTRRMQAGVEQRHRAAVTGVGGCVWRLKALDPFATLERGYAILQQGAVVVSSIEQPHAGDTLDVRVKDGSFGVTVGSGQPPQKRRSKRKVPDAQAPLFTMPEERA